MYADDSALVSADIDPNIVSHNLQLDLANVNLWFKANRLSVNCSKTQCILFTSNRSKHKQFQLDLTLDGENLNQVTEMKYLGLILDRHLTFENHVNSICRKVSIRTKMLWRVRCFIPRSLARILYQSLIYTHFTYCNFIIDAASENLKSKLQCYHNSALRAILNVDVSYSTERLLIDVGVDSIRVDMRKSACKFVYKGFYDRGPDCLNAMFTLYVPCRELRSGDELCIAPNKCRTSFGQRNLATRGCTYWNSLPTDIKAKTSADSFKKALKKYDGLD